MLNVGESLRGDRGSMVVYFPQQQEKEKRKYQLIGKPAPTPFPGYSGLTTVKVHFEVLRPLSICHSCSTLH